MVLWIEEKACIESVLVPGCHVCVCENGGHVRHMRSFASTPWAQQMCSTQCIWWMKLFESSNPCRGDKPERTFGDWGSA